MEQAAPITHHSSLWGYTLGGGSIAVGFALTTLGGGAVAGLLPGPGIYYGPPLIVLGLILTGGGGAHVARAKKKSKEIDPKARVISLHHLTQQNCLEIAPSLANCTKLTALNFSEGEIDYGGIKALALSFPASLLLLDLSDNWLGIDSVGVVVQAVPSSLNNLDLSKNEIGELKGNLKSLHFNRLEGLRMLNLSKNSLKLDHALEIITHLPPSLLQLDLTGNLLTRYEIERVKEKAPETLTILHSWSEEECTQPAR